jgi:hypothetical protein
MTTDQTPPDLPANDGVVFVYAADPTASVALDAVFSSSDKCSTGTFLRLGVALGNGQSVGLGTQYAVVLTGAATLTNIDIPKKAVQAGMVQVSQPDDIVAGGGLVGQATIGRLHIGEVHTIGGCLRGTVERRSHIFVVDQLPTVGADVGMAGSPVLISVDSLGLEHDGVATWYTPRDFAVTVTLLNDITPGHYGFDLLQPLPISPQTPTKWTSTGAVAPQLIARNGGAATTIAVWLAVLGISVGVLVSAVFAVAGPWIERLIKGGHG